MNQQPAQRFAMPAAVVVLAIGAVAAALGVARLAGDGDAPTRFAVRIEGDAVVAFDIRRGFVRDEEFLAGVTGIDLTDDRVVPVGIARAARNEEDTVLGVTILAEREPGDEEDNTSWSERLALIEGNHRASGTIEAATLTEKSDRTELIVMSRRHRGDFRLDAYITFHAGPFVAIVGEGDADVRALFEGVIATLELSDPPNGVTPSGLRDG